MSIFQSFMAEEGQNLSSNVLGSVSEDIFPLLDFCIPEVCKFQEKTFDTIVFFHEKKNF